MADRVDVLEALETHITESGVPFGTAPDLVEHVDISRRSVLDKLELLEAAGTVESRRIGSGRAFWPSDLLEERHGDVPLAEPPAEPLAEPEPTAEPVGEIVQEDDLEEQISQLELPGSGSVLEQRQHVVRLCYDYLREAGTASKSDFVEEIYPEHPAHYGSSGGWWNAIGKEGLQQLADLRDDIEPPAGEGSHQWQAV